jgi:hypothetical protein
MSDELKPQSIDTPEFRELMSAYWRSCGSASAGTAANALIAYIDAWGARLAGVPAGYMVVPIEPTPRMREAAASFGHPDAGPSYPEGYISQRGNEAVESYRHMLAAAPKPEAPCGS